MTPNDKKKSITILLAEDDQDDREIIQEALREGRVLNEVFIVEDGEELMDFLYHSGRFKDHLKSPRPGIILLDLNMPKKDGREALLEIKQDKELKRIPVVVLTTSKEEEDIIRSYDIGASSYITKPVTFKALVDAMESLGKYWFDLVELPLQYEGEQND